MALLLLGAADAGCYDYMACGQCPDGCVWCAADLICAPENNMPTGSSLYLSGYTAITCDADDYTDTCPERDDPYQTRTTKLNGTWRPYGPRRPGPRATPATVCKFW